MTRDEFLEHAGKEVDTVLGNRKNRMLNLVEQAWAEGKRNAEVETLKEAIDVALRAKDLIDMPVDEDNCVLLYKGEKYKCKMGQTCILQDGYGMIAKRKFEIYEV